jgi:hypothetical protein
MNKVMDMNMDTGTDINIDMDKGMGTRRELSDYLSIDFRTKFCPTCSMLLSFPNSERQQALERCFHCGAAEVRDYPLFLSRSLLRFIGASFCVVFPRLFLVSARERESVKNRRCLPLPHAYTTVCVGSVWKSWS